MNRMLLTIAVVVVAVFGICAVASVADNDKEGGTEGTGPQLYFVKNMSDDLLDLYLGQKDSSEMTLINDGGTFDIPENPVIIVKAKNPSGDLSVKDGKIVIPTSSDTYYVTVAFDKVEPDAPVLSGSDSAYVAFTPDPSYSIINLGLFVTNYDS